MIPTKSVITDMEELSQAQVAGTTYHRKYVSRLVERDPGHGTKM